MGSEEQPAKGFVGLMLAEIPAMTGLERGVLANQCPMVPVLLVFPLPLPGPYPRPLLCFICILWAVL